MYKELIRFDVVLCFNLNKEGEVKCYENNDNIIKCANLLLHFSKMLVI